MEIREAAMHRMHPAAREGKNVSRETLFELPCPESILFAGMSSELFHVKHQPTKKPFL